MGWSHAAEEAFQTLTDRCTNAPILAYADFSLPLELYIDASGTGLGAVLYQTQDGKKRVIAYASRTLPKVKPDTQLTNWNSLPLNGPSLISSMNTCMETHLQSTQIIIH